MQQPTATLSQELRARRDAADRCPPMPCGHRDPLDTGHLDRHRGMTPPVLWCTTDETQGRVLLTGTVDVRRLLHRLAIPARWSASGRGYVVPARLLGDVLAYAETTGVVTRCRDRR